MSNKLEIHERFKDARTVYNKNGKQTMSEVESATGIQKSMISSLEKDDTRGASFRDIAKLAKHYGVSMDWLCGLTDIRDSDVDVIEICKKVGLSEEAAQKFCRAKAAGESGSPLVFLNSMMLLPDELLERLSNCFVAYILVQYLGVSGIKEKYNFPGNLSLSLSVNNFKLPEVSVDESLDYSRFELTRSVVQAADCISSSAYAAVIGTLFCGGC